MGALQDSVNGAAPFLCSDTTALVAFHGNGLGSSPREDEPRTFYMENGFPRSSQESASADVVASCFEDPSHRLIANILAELDNIVVNTVNGLGLVGLNTRQEVTSAMSCSDVGQEQQQSPTGLGGSAMVHDKRPQGDPDRQPLGKKRRTILHRGDVTAISPSACDDSNEDAASEGSEHDDAQDLLPPTVAVVHDRCASFLNHIDSLNIFMVPLIRIR